MNVEDLLYRFLDKANSDPKIGVRHISLYVNVLRLSDRDDKTFVRISRSELMCRSKIFSKSTYHKSIKDLNNWGYISYRPSYNPSKKSIVVLVKANFETGNEIISNK